MNKKDIILIGVIVLWFSYCWFIIYVQEVTNCNSDQDEINKNLQILKDDYNWNCQNLENEINLNVKELMTNYKIKNCSCNYAGNESCGCFCDLYNLNDEIIKENWGVRIWI